MSKNVERRITTWTLVIHPEDKTAKDELFFKNEDLESYLRECFSPKTECYFINHNKDKEKDGKAKTNHSHVVIKLPHNQGKTFTAMKRLFPTSHIEPVVEWTNAVLYLTHETINAKEEGKTLYDRSEVVNVFGTDFLSYFNKPQVELFDMDQIESYIVDRGFRSILDFGRCFGFSTIAPRWHIIKDIIKELDIETNHKPQELTNDYIFHNKVEYDERTLEEYEEQEGE